MRLPIIDHLIKMNDSKMTSFHVPGHKNGRIFKLHNYKDMFHNLGNLDTTEISGTDNLHKPVGIIKDSQNIAREVFNSKESFFLVNGSTAGIYSMIMATTSPGDKIIINRNCHQSVIQACVLGDLHPVYVYPEFDMDLGIALGISPEEIEKQILLNIDAKVVLITYPTYEGVISNLKKIAEIVHKYDKILLVDEAHGAHLGLSEKLPKSALELGADIVVQSLHKTLPTLTQGAILHIQGNRIDIDKLKFMLRIHQSSSPSYILMASIEYAIMIYKNYGHDLMEKLLVNITDFKETVKKIKAVDIFDSSNLINRYEHDPTKLYIYSKHKEFTGLWLENYLRENFNVQMELSSLQGVLGIATIGNDKTDFDSLLKAIISLDKIDFEPIKNHIGVQKYPLAQVKLIPREGVYGRKRKVKLRESSGLVSGEYIIPYPPGIPLIIPGEVITEEVIEYIILSVNRGINMVGLKDETYEYIEVVI